MVLLNSRITNTKVYDNIDFKYLIDVPRCDCVFCSARERSTGKTHLFLVFNHKGKIYRRDGIRSSWIELRNEEEYSQIRELLIRAISDKSIPCYTTAKEYVG